MQDAQQQFEFARASRDARIDALPVPDRVKLLFRAIDRIALMMIDVGSPAAFVDDGQVLVAEIPVPEIARLMNVAERTIRRAIGDARRTPHLDVDDSPGRLSVFCLRWQTIPQVSGVPPVRGDTVSGVTPPGVRGDTPKNVEKPDPGHHPGHLSHETHEIENQRFKTQNSIEGAGVTPDSRTPDTSIRQDVLQRARRWAWTRDQLANAEFVDLIIVPAAIARFELPDSEQIRQGIRAAACCAVHQGRDSGALFTDLVKRCAWNGRGRQGIAERWFDQAAGLRSVAPADGYDDQLAAANEEAREFERNRQEAIAGLREFESEWRQQQLVRAEDPSVS